MSQQRFRDELDSQLNRTFDRNLHTLDNANRGISSKEAVITTHRYESKMMDRKIYALYYGLLYIVVIFLLIILHRYNVVSNLVLTMILAGATTGIIWTMYAIYNQEDVLLLQAQLQEKLHPAPVDEGPNQCPWSCPDAPANDFVDLTTDQSKYPNDMSHDYSANKWQQGDRPEYGPIDPANLPKYKCEWNLGVTGSGRNGMPAQFITTVPCDNYPGYHEVLSKS